jgi:hypothetical protein
MNAAAIMGMGGGASPLNREPARVGRVGRIRRSDVVAADNPHVRTWSPVTSTASMARSTMDSPGADISPGTAFRIQRLISFANRAPL